MTLKETIKILTHYKVEGEAPCPPALDNALQVGIEAVELLQRLRAGERWPLNHPLPSETED